MVADRYFSEHYDSEEDGRRGVLNSSLLLSALGVSKQTYGGKDLYSDIYTKAAGLMRSLAINHCFHDGNKRTAMMSTIIFLEQNGCQFEAPNNKMYRLCMKIVREKPTPTINNIAKTLRKYCKEPDHVETSFYSRLVKSIVDMIAKESKEEKKLKNRKKSKRKKAH